MQCSNRKICISCTNKFNCNILFCIKKKIIYFNKCEKKLFLFYLTTSHPDNNADILSSFKDEFILEIAIKHSAINFDSKKNIILNVYQQILLLLCN